MNEEVVYLRAAANINSNLRGKMEDSASNSKPQNDSNSISPTSQKHNLALQKEQSEKIENLEKTIQDYKEKLSKSAKELDCLKDDMKEMMTRQRDSGTIATTAIIQIDKELSNLKQELEAKTVSNEKLEVEIKQLQMEIVKLERSEEELLDENANLKRKREEFDNYKTNNVFNYFI